MALFKVPKFAFVIPWYIFDITNKQLITSKTIPADIVDNKQVFIVETNIPGLNYNPIQAIGGGVRKISMTLPIVKRNNTIGTLGLLNQFKTLRNTSGGLLNFFTRQFDPLPKVIYNWGTGSAPMPCYVSKCDFSSNGALVNQLGNPQYTIITIELTVDEKSPLYKMEESFRKLNSFVGRSVFARKNIGIIGKKLNKGKQF